MLSEFFSFVYGSQEKTNASWKQMLDDKISPKLLSIEDSLGKIDKDINDVKGNNFYFFGEKPLFFDFRFIC